MTPEMTSNKEEVVLSKFTNWVRLDKKKMHIILQISLYSRLEGKGLDINLGMRKSVKSF